MNPMERMLLTLKHKEADRVPIYPILSGVTRKLVGASYKEWTLKPEITAEALLKAQERFDLDAIVTLTDLSVEAADYGQQLLFSENDAAHPDFNNLLLKTTDDFKKLDRLNPKKTQRMGDHIKLCEMLVKERGQEVPIVAFNFAPLGLLSMMRGQAELFMDLIENPELVHQAMEVLTENMIAYNDALAETGVAAIMMDTLFASGTIMSKEMWSEFEGPYVRKIAARLHEQGTAVMIHNCGNDVYFDVQIEEMKPEMISFNKIPDDCDSMEEIKRKYGNITTLCGMLDPAWLNTHSAIEIEKACKEQIDIFAPGGGYVLASGCEYAANGTWEAAETMKKVAQTYGRYDK